MRIPLKIEVRNLPHSEALEQRVREGVAKLEEFHPRIVSCRVAIEESGMHHRHGRQFEVRIDLRVPGDEIVVNRFHDEDVYVAVRNALNAVRRQLRETARIMRGEKKARPGESRRKTPA